jgi:glycosyltransferase involved in cell wall biosynthesis
LSVLPLSRKRSRSPVDISQDGRSDDRLRVLISAYACSPDIGSEAAVGWNWAIAAARRHEVWVLTWTLYRDSLERELAQRPIPHLHFAYYDLPRPVRDLPLSERHEYLLWEFFALSAGRKLHRQHRFDVIHHLTFNTVEVPGLLWTLGPPFVWGPLGGGQVPPASLRGYYGRLWPIEVIRSLRKRLLWLNPLVRLATPRAAAVLAANRETSDLIARFKPRRLIDEPEIGIAAPATTPVVRPSNRTPQVLWAGRLVPRKGPLLALDIATELKRRGLCFRIRMLGKGSWRPLIARSIADRDLAEVVELVGSVDYREMARVYHDADVFLFTSLQDTSGLVLLEGMSDELPVVALDHQGAASIVSPEWGIKVPVGDRAAVVNDFADALEALFKDPERRRAMGRAGRLRAAERYSWEAKAGLLEKLYAEVAAEASAARGADARV